MRVLHAVFLLWARVLMAAVENPFPAAEALLPQHQHAEPSGPAPHAR